MNTTVSESIRLVEYYGSYETKHVALFAADDSDSGSSAEVRRELGRRLGLLPVGLDWVNPS